MKIVFYTITLIMAFSLSSHEIKLENKATEEIINERMKRMNNINNLSQKIYKQLASLDFDILKKNTLKLKHAAVEFQHLFPIDSNGGKAKDLVWENKTLFDEYNKNFVDSIDSMLIDIKVSDIISLKNNFNNMASNCGSCHKKFKNKK